MAVSVATGVIYWRNDPDPGQRPAALWRRLLTWWPRRRAWFFLVGNVCFVLAYLVPWREQLG